MQTIKFRAWDNVAFEMYYPGEEENIVFALEDNGIVATDITQEEEEFQTLHHLEYMQFTGQKDNINDTPIYEGDVVKGKYWLDGKSYRFIGSVEYIGIGFKASGVKQYEGINVEFNPTFEVIGNIYENPELLKEETK